MKRIGIFVDISNLYFCLHKRYRGRKLDYQKYYNFVSDLGDITLAFAYGAQVGTEADRFVKKLKAIGFEPKYKQPKEFKEAEPGRAKRKADWDVGITIDIVNMVDRVDTIVLGSADGDMEPVVSWCRNKGVKVIILASGISDDLRASANECIEIPESLLESR